MKQAPSWNRIVELFQSNDDVVFGDVEYSQDRIRVINGVAQKPGVGGWPSFRYFNKTTGYGGESYAKKTKKRMCDELGPTLHYMQEFVEEVGCTLPCSLNRTAGCSAKLKAFIEKSSSASRDKLDKQLDRLENLVKTDAVSRNSIMSMWSKQRIDIVKQLIKSIN